VAIRSGWRTAKQVRHVVTSIVAPMGPPLSARPPVPSEEERLGAVELRRAAKDARQASRGRKAAQGRVAERDRIRRWNAADERRERMSAESLLRLQRASPEEKAVEEVIAQLTKATAIADGKRLAAAMEACKAHYTSAPGRQQARLRTQEWQRALLDDTHELRPALAVLVQGESSAAAAGIDSTAFHRARDIAAAIRRAARRTARIQARHEARAAKFLEAAARGGAGNAPSTALAALDASAAPADLRAFLAAHEAAFGDIALPAAPPLDAAVPVPALLDALRAAIETFEAQAAALAAQGGAADGAPARRELLRLARARADGVVARLERQVGALETLWRVVREHRLVRERPEVFWRTVKALGIVTPDSTAVGQLFGFARKERDDAGQSADGAVSGQVGTEESTNSGESHGVHMDGEKESSGMVDEKQQQDVR